MQTILNVRSDVRYGHHLNINLAKSKALVMFTCYSLLELIHDGLEQFFFEALS